MKEYKGKISVIMPAHNEGYHIYQNLKETQEVFEKAGCDYEIVLVNDGSSDNTSLEALKAANESSRIKLVEIKENHGKGHALKEGFNHVTGDVTIFLDADLDIHPNQLQILFNIMRLEKADVVIGSKRHPQSRLNYPWHRKLISNIYALMLLCLFRLPLKDTQSGLKIYKTEVLKKVFPIILCKRYAFDVEILANAHHLGYRVVEAPIILNYRRVQKWGRIRLRDLYYSGIDTLAIFYRMYILRHYDKQLFR